MMNIPLSDCTSAYQNADNIQLNTKTFSEFAKSVPSLSVQGLSGSYTYDSPYSPFRSPTRYVNNPYDCNLIIGSSEESFEDSFEACYTPETPTTPQRYGRRYTNKDRWLPTPDGAPSTRPSPCALRTTTKSVEAGKLSCRQDVPSFYESAGVTEMNTSVVLANTPTRNGNPKKLVKTVVAYSGIDRSSGRPVVRPALPTVIS